MARPKRTDPQVNLKETAGSDQAGVDQAVYSWALLLADRASETHITRSRDHSAQKDPPTGR